MPRLVIGCVLLGLVLAGCIPGREPPAAPLPPVGEARVALERAACEKRGGEFRKAGAGGWVCLIRLPDADKSCRTGADCAGACLARSMTCAPVKPLLGCNEVITSSGLRVRECVE